HQFWRQFKRNHAAEISLYLILGFILAAILAPSISPYDPFVMGDETLQPPQSDHLMGTDDLGRDTLSRVIYGARVPLAVGFLAARCLGLSHRRMLFKEILPHAIPPAIVLASFFVAREILLEAGLSFLGLRDPNLISWGSLLSVAQERMWSSMWLAIFPGMAMS